MQLSPKITQFPLLVVKRRHLHGKNFRPDLYQDWGAKTEAALIIPMRKRVDAKI